MDPDRLDLRPGARRFDLGNDNYLGAAATNTSVAMLNELGTREIEAHVRLSVRCGSLRFSLHLYNNADDVDRVVDLTRQWGVGQRA